MWPVKYLPNMQSVSIHHYGNDGLVFYIPFIII